MFCSQISSPRLLEDKVSGGHTCASVDRVCVCVCVCVCVREKSHCAVGSLIIRILL